MTTEADEVAIEAAVDRLYAQHRTPHYEQTRSDLVKELDVLASRDVASVLAVVERHLQALGGVSPDVDRLNHSLNFFFDFFESRQSPRIRSFVERALQLSPFRMKERYIQTLEELGDPDSVRTLVTLLSLHRGDRIEDDDVRVAVLKALTGYFPPLADPSPVLSVLNDRALRVRSAALQYLSAHLDARAVPVLAARVQVEDDPDLLVTALDLLGTVAPAKALTAAEQRLTSTPAGETDIVEPLQLAVGELRERSRGL